MGGSFPTLLAIGLVSAALLTIELALTRVFSVTMYYHFAFLAISIALFGLSASGVYAFVGRRRFTAAPAGESLSRHALAFAVVTLVALALLVRLRVGLTYSPRNLALMVAIYLLAALPFFTGGAVISLALAKAGGRANLVYAADLVGAAIGCVLLVPLMNALGGPGAIVFAAAMGAAAAVLSADRARRRARAILAVLLFSSALGAQIAGAGPFTLADTKGHRGDRVLFSKWNSFSRIGVYDRSHGDWSLSPRYKGPLPDTRYMDIDSAASTPILRLHSGVDEAAYLRYELTAFAYHAVPEGFTTLVIGPGGGRDLVSALVFGAGRVDAVEINPIIANDVMRGRFAEYSGRVYEHPKVRIFVEDGRSYVRRTPERYDVIQASLVDTWAATAAGAYTLTENSLYTVEAFGDYLDHLTERGVLTITRWMFDGLRLVSLARSACGARGWDVASRIAIVKHGRIATFLLKRQPFTADEIWRLRVAATELGFRIVYAPGDRAEPDAAPRWPGRAEETITPADYRRAVLTSDPERFYAAYPLDITPTTDDRPFFFHTTKLEHQFATAFGRSMLFGNGLSALMTLMGISGTLVVAFVVGPLAVARGELPGSRWAGWLVYFAALGAGFMLVEVALLQRLVLLLGHPVYSLAVTLFALLLGTGTGSYLSRRFPEGALRRRTLAALVLTAASVAVAAAALPLVVDAAMPLARAARLTIAAALLLPIGIVMGVPLPSGMRMLAARRGDLIPWGWALNGALSVVGATAAVFIAMNWGFTATLIAGASVYLMAAVACVLVTAAPVSVSRRP